MSPPLHLLSVLLPPLTLFGLLAVLAGTPWYAAMGFAYAALAVAELTYLATLLVGRGPGLEVVRRPTFRA